MRTLRPWLTIPVAVGFIAPIGFGLRGRQADDPRRLPVAGVIKLWRPMPDGMWETPGSSPAAMYDPA